MEGENKIIVDTFIYNSQKYVVLNNALVKNAAPGLLLLGQVVLNNGRTEIEPLADEEYDDVAGYYLSLILAMKKGEDE